MEAILGALKSKTIWASLIAAIAPLIFPAVDAWVAAHPGPAGLIVGAVFGVLRMLTTQSLTTKGTGSPSPPVSP